MEDTVLLERFELAMERIGEIAGESTVEEPYRSYFKRTAGFLLTMEGLYGEIINGNTKTYTLEQWKTLNKSLYQDILPENYQKSYANPDYAQDMLGESYSKPLSFLYIEIRRMIGYAFEASLENLVIRSELFIEIYNAFEGEKLPSYHEIQQILYWFESDYSDLFMEQRIQSRLDSKLDFGIKIVMESDFNDLRYLYQYGEYISENEFTMAQYINALPKEKIKLMADTYTEGFRQGFIQGRKDISKKGTVQIGYALGFERVIRAAVENFRKLGLEPVIFRGGYVGSNPNKQCSFDHRADEALYLDKNFVERRLGAMRSAYEKLKDLAAKTAGPAYVDVFGEVPFAPLVKESACRLSEKQQKLTRELQNEAGQIKNKYVSCEETSFTIIAFPTPEIGERFPEIFDEIIKVNTLDYNKYQKIQQAIIDALDQGIQVQVLGKGENHTDITVALTELKDPSRETIFENCVADVNIPVGEVFTSPKLKGTNGVLEVSEAFLCGLCYKKLRIVFEDGMVTEYSCKNFDSEEKNKDYMRENVMYHHDTLPLGEFAIGTNTTAYAMAEKYQIGDKLPVLIAEKMGPHFALGDTCYSWSEDIAVYNPDGKEIIARDNEVSLLRREDISKAYMGCHTDITIPYKELDAIRVICKDGRKISIIENGRFVLRGTEELNEPLK